MWGPAVAALGVQRPGLPVYNYPGWLPLILAPFGTMPLDPAARLWLALTLVVGAVGLFVLLDEVAPRLPLAFTLFGFALVASEPGIVTFYSGQWGFLIVGLLSFMVVALRRGAPGVAGAFGAIMIVKPQLFLVAVPALMRSTLRTRGPRFTLIFLAVSAVAAIASTIAFPTWWGEYLAVPAAKAGDIRAAALPNAMRDVFDAPGLVSGVLLDSLLLASCFRFSPRSDAWPAVWLAVSLVTAPYIFVYDHVVMIVPLVIATGLIAQRRTRHALLFAAIGFAIMVAGATAIHAFPGVALGSLAVEGFALYAVAALVIFGLWGRRHGLSDSPIATRPATAAR